MSVAGDLRRIVETERERFAVPGCAVVVVAGGEVVLCDGFGSRDLERGLPVTTGTLFPVASSTKTFTAALCAVLVDEGTLAWDRPVRDYLPRLRLSDPVAAAHATVTDLLCHRSGLPRHDLIWYAGQDTLTRDDLLRALPHLPPSRGFRQEWQYNNLLYTVAGVLAGELAGAGSYEAAVRERLLDPLGMARTNFSVEMTGADPDAARPYVAPAPGEPVKPVGYARLDLIAPAGALNSSVADLAPWLLTLLGHGVGGRPPLLSGSALAALRSPVAPLPDGSELAVGTPVGYGLGATVEDYRGHRIVHHGGNIDGFSCQVSIVPEADVGVAVLGNRDGTVLPAAVACLLYERLLGLAPSGLGEQLLAKEVAIHRGRGQHRERTGAAGAGLPAVRPLTDYAGTYRHPGYGDLVISVDGAGPAAGLSGLSGRYLSLAGPLRHRHLEVFNLVVDLGGIETPLPVQFFHDLDGQVSAAELPAEPAVPPVRFTRVAGTAHLTGELLDRLAGTYRMGPLTAIVARRGAAGLVARIVEGPFQELIPLRGLVFQAGSGSGGRVEFTEDGRLVTQAGEFTRAD